MSRRSGESSDGVGHLRSNVKDYLQFTVYLGGTWFLHWKDTHAPWFLGGTRATTILPPQAWPTPAALPCEAGA